MLVASKTLLVCNLITRVRNDFVKLVWEVMLLPKKLLVFPVTEPTS